MIVHVDKKEIVAYVSTYTSVTLLLFKDVLPFLQSAVVQALILMTLVIINIKSTRIKELAGIKWYGLFAFVSIFSYLLNNKIPTIYTICNALLYITVFSLIMANMKCIKKAFIAFSFIGLLLFVYIYLKFHSLFGYGRLGDYMEGTTYESSIQFSYYIIAILCSSFVVAFMENVKRCIKIIAVISIVVGFLIAIFNGAKKGYITPLFFVIIYTFIKNRKNAFKLCLYTSVIILILWIIWDYLKDIDILQKYFINRIESMFAAFVSGSGADADGSTSERISYIPVALDAFMDSPIWGMGGLGYSTSYFLQTIGVSHPHNDFLNLLAAGGILLFIIYYWLPFKLLGKCCFNVNYKEMAIMLALVSTLLFNNLNSSTFNIPVINVFYIVIYKYLVYIKLYSKMRIQHRYA